MSYGSGGGMSGLLQKHVASGQLHTGNISGPRRKKKAAPPKPAPKAAAPPPAKSEARNQTLASTYREAKKQHLK